MSSSVTMPTGVVVLAIVVFAAGLVLAVMRDELEWQDVLGDLADEGAYVCGDVVLIEVDGAEVDLTCSLPPGHAGEHCARTVDHWTWPDSIEGDDDVV